MSSFELTREEQEAMSGGEVKTTKKLWETGSSSSSTSSGHGNHAGTGDKENIIEKEVLLARERERQLRREREERAKQLQAQAETPVNTSQHHDTPQVSHHQQQQQQQQHHDDTHAPSASSHAAVAPAASHHTDSPTPAVKVVETHNLEHAEQQHHHNTSHEDKHNHHVTDAAAAADRDNSSMPKPAPTVHVSYEEIIAEVKHKGEGRVFDEIQQQKAREDELRRNYGDRGIHVASYQSSSVISVSRPSPAANHSEPVTQHLHDNDNHSAVSHSNGIDKPAAAHNDDHHVSARKVSSTEAAAPSANSVPQSSPSPVVEGNKDAESGGPIAGRRVSSVHRNSWLTADTTDSAYRYMPHVETPIEREIRLNQERESELRSKTAALVNTLTRGESVEQKPIAASSIRRQRQDKTDVNVKEKRRTFEVETTTSESSNNNNDSNDGGVTSGKWDKRRASEIVIEKELREMRAREEELRLTRISK